LIVFRTYKINAFLIGLIVGDWKPGLRLTIEEAGSLLIASKYIIRDISTVCVWSQGPDNSIELQIDGIKAEIASAFRFQSSLLLLARDTVCFFLLKFVKLFLFETYVLILGIVRRFCICFSLLNTKILLSGS